MSSNFSFGNLTINGKKLTWDDIKKYDANNDGNIDTTEYNALVKELDPDGFNGISAFGKIDTDKNGKVSESEFDVISQKVEISDYVDSQFETQAGTATTDGTTTNGGVTTDYQTAAVAFMNNYVTTYTANKNNDTSKMYENFQTAFAEFQKTYQETQAKISATKSDTTIAQKLFSAVDDGNKNGYVDKDESLAIKTASKDYAVQQALNGDYTFLTSIGVKAADLTSIKTLVNNLSSSADPAGALTNLQTAIGKLISSASMSKIISTSQGLEKTKTASDQANYKIDSSTLDYSKVEGFEKNETETVKKRGADGAKDKAKETIEGLKEQIKAQIEANLKATGSTLNEELFNNVFAAAEQNAVDASVTGKSGGTFHHSSSSYNAQDLVKAFITDFNAKIEDTLKTMAKDKTTNTNLPTEAAMTTDLLGTSSDNLSNDEKKLKELQQKNLTAGTTTKVSTTEAEDAIEILTEGLKTRMKAELGSKYNENKAANILNEAKTEVLAGIDENTTLSTLITKFMATFQTNYAASKTSISA